VKFHVHTSEACGGALGERWRQIQEADPRLASPYFRPEFTECVAAVRDDVSIGVVEEAGRIVGFFPFHRGRGGVGRPIGLGLSDYQGVIVEGDPAWTAEELLRGCGLVSYAFDHLPVTQSVFGSCITRTDESPIIALDGGFEGFRASRDRSGRKQLRETERKRERLESEAGPLRIVAASDDADVLRTLIGWKSRQCREAGTVDYFERAWCVGLVEHLHARRGEAFGGRLFGLYCGETLVAAHFVLRAGNVWHSWFPGYDQRFHEYSPGMVLLVEMIRMAADEGVAWIDLGRGVSLYKRRVMTGTITVGEGRAETPSIINRARRFREETERWARGSILEPVLRGPGRMLKNAERRRRYG